MKENHIKIARRARAIMLMRCAANWIANNPRAWDYMTENAANEVFAHRRFSVQWLVEEARKKDFAPNDGGRFSINNNLCPAFARILICEYPECRPFIETRHSVLDEVEI